MSDRGTATDWHGLGLLRFALAWIVLSGHLAAFAAPAPWVHAADVFGGKAAVIGFLMVSGYSIAASLERGQTGFYWRRFLRIYPLYLWSVLIAGVLQIASTSGRSPAALYLPAVVNGGYGWGTIFGNVLLLQTFAVKPIAFDGPVWSLAVEASYYLLAPLLFRLRPAILLALVLVSAACYCLPPHPELGFLYRIPSKLNALCYLWCWVLGFLLRLYPTRRVVGLAVAGVLLVALGRDQSPLGWATYLVSIAVIVGATRRMVPRSLRRVADYLGDLSYPLYLIHFPAFIVGWLYLGAARSPWLQLALGLTAAVVSYHVVDRYLKPRFIVPWVRWKREARLGEDAATIAS